MSTHFRAVADGQSLQGPGQTETHQDVEHVTADGVGHCHISHS